MERDGNGQVSDLGSPHICGIQKHRHCVGTGAGRQQLQVDRVVSIAG